MEDCTEMDARPMIRGQQGMYSKEAVDRLSLPDGKVRYLAYERDCDILWKHF